MDRPGPFMMYLIAIEESGAHRKESSNGLSKDFTPEDE